jgi:hypothetical protein
MTLLLSFILTFSPINTDSSRLEVYKTHLNDLDNSNVENIDAALVLFDSLSVSPPDSVNDKMFEEFRDYYFKTIRYINSNNIDDSKFYQYDDKYNNPYADSLTTLLNAFGIDIFSTEGSFYADQMVGYLSKTFSGKLTEAYKEFLERRAFEMRRPFSEDAMLLVPISTVTDRMLFWEDFLKRYPDSHISSSAGFFYEHYLGILITGTDNSRVYDLNTNIFREDVIRIYKRIISEYPDRRSAQMLSGYLEEVKRNDFIFNENITEYIETNNLPSMRSMQPIAR